MPKDILELIIAVIALIGIGVYNLCQWLTELEAEYRYQEGLRKG